MLQKIKKSQKKLKSLVSLYLNYKTLSLKFSKLKGVILNYKYNFIQAQTSVSLYYTHYF